MRRCLVGFLFLITTVLFSVITEERDFETFLFGDDPDFTYNNWYSHVAENIAREGYNQYSPYDKQMVGFGSFTELSEADSTAWRLALECLVNDNSVGAENLLSNAEYPFEVVQLSDTGTGKTYNLIREIPDTSYVDDNQTPETFDDEIGAFTYGWGLYLKNPESTNPIIISMIHPCDDFIALPLALYAFNKLNARYLFINGAGREVRQSNSGMYTNDRSYSDPSRHSEHAYNIAYKEACDEIRTTFGISEFTLQVHSYDYNSTVPYDVILSSGFAIPYNNPIRDVSDAHNDIVNRLPYQIPIAGDFLVNRRNTVLDYLAVAGNSYNPPYYYLNGESYNIPMSFRYYGIDTSYQFIYTRNYCDSNQFQNWLHVEMRELPGYCNDYYAFYGYDYEANTWIPDNFYTNVIEYNSHWIDALSEVIDDNINRTDDLEIVDSISPLELEIDYDYHGNPSAVELTWDQCSSFDFHCYEVESALNDSFTEEYEVLETITNPRTLAYLINLNEVTGMRWLRLKATDYQGNVVYSNPNFIDTDLSIQSIAVYPPISYSIRPEPFGVSYPYVNLVVENNGNKLFTVNEVICDDRSFNPLLPESGLPVYPCSSSELKVELTGGYHQDKQAKITLMIDADNVDHLGYKVVVTPLETEEVSPELIKTTSGLMLSWNGEPSISYTVLWSDNPYTGFQEIAEVTGTSFSIDVARRGFFKVVKQ